MAISNYNNHFGYRFFVNPLLVGIDKINESLYYQLLYYYIGTL